MYYGFDIRVLFTHNFHSIFGHDYINNENRHIYILYIDVNIQHEHIAGRSKSHSFAHMIVAQHYFFISEEYT